MQKSNMFISLVVLGILLCSIPIGTADDETIRIIQGALYLYGDPDTNLISNGVNITIHIENEEPVNITTVPYVSVDDINYGSGFKSIEAGKKVSFTVELNSVYQSPDQIELNGKNIKTNYITITDDSIYHVNLYFKVDTPYNPVPINGSTTINPDQNLSWSFDTTGKTNVKYNVYFGTNTTPIYRNATTYKSHDPGELSYNTTYYWRINATSDDEYWLGPLWHFTTKQDPYPTVSAGTSYNGVVNQAIQFTGSASGGKPPYTFSWNFGDGGFSSSQNPVHTYTSSGTYTVGITVTDADNYSSTHTTKAVITSSTVDDDNTGGMISNLQIKGPSQADMNKEISIELSAIHSAQGLLSYSINWGDDSVPSTKMGFSDTPITMTHTYAAEGNYEITVTAGGYEDASVMKQTKTHSITINPVGGFPWIYIIILVIVIAVAGVLYYLYQNDQLPIAKKSKSSTNTSPSTSESSVKDFFSRTFQRNKTSSSNANEWEPLQQYNQPDTSIPQPTQSSTLASEPTKTSISSQSPNNSKSREEKKPSSKPSDEGLSEFKRL